MIERLISDLYNKALEDVLRQVLAQYLGRQAELEDGKRLTIGTFPDDRPMMLAIDGHHVGTIKIELNGSKITATFNPS